MSDKYLIAVGDIAGFKNKVKGTKDFKELITLVDSFIEYINHAILYLEGEHIESRDKVTKYKFKHAIFSDTILIWYEIAERNLSKKRGELFFQSMGNVIAASIMHNLPLRLGVAYGECYIHKKFNVYIGKPIVDAYELSEAQEWIGGAIHNSCIILPNTNSIVNFKPPIKTNDKGETYTGYLSKTIDWTRFVIRREEKDAIKNTIQENIENNKDDDKIIKMWSQTKNFYCSLKKNP